MPLSVGQPNSAPQGGLAVAQAPIGMPASLSVQQAPTQQVGEPLTAPSTALAVQQPPVIQAINTASQRGASPEQIVQQLIQSNPDKQQEFQTAIQRGAQPQDIINEVLKQNGGQPADSTNSDSTQPVEQKSVGGFLENAVSSTGNVVKNIFSGLVNILNTNPDQNTVVNVAKIAGGLLASPVIIGHNLVVGKNAGEAGGWQLNDKPLENLTDSLASRYGSVDKLKETLYTDPAGVLLDAATILDPIAKGVGLAGDVLDATDASTMAAKTNAAAIAAATDNPMLRMAATQYAGESTNALSKAGELGAKVVETINPVNALGKTIDWTKAGLQSLAPKLEEANLRLTPTQQVTYANKLDDVTSYIAKEIPVGSPQTRFDAITQKAADMETKVQDLLTKDAKGITVDRSSLLQQVEGLKTEFNGERDALEIDKQIDGFKTLLEAKYPDQIPVNDINTLKRSTFQSAFNAAGTKVSDAVEYRLGDVLYDNLKTATQDVGGKSLQDLNKEYSTVITAKKLLKVAMGRPQVNFVDRLVSGVTGGIIGNAFGGPIGSAVGGFIGKTVADQIPATGIKSVIGKTATMASKLVPKVSPAIGGELGAVSRLSTYSKPPAKLPKLKELK